MPPLLNCPGIRKREGKWEAGERASSICFGRVLAGQGHWIGKCHSQTTTGPNGFPAGPVYPGLSKWQPRASAHWLVPPVWCHLWTWWMCTWMLSLPRPLMFNRACPNTDLVLVTGPQPGHDPLTTETVQSNFTAPRNRRLHCLYKTEWIYNSNISNCFVGYTKFQKIIEKNMFFSHLKLSLWTLRPTICADNI